MHRILAGTAVVLGLCVAAAAPAMVINAGDEAEADRIIRGAENNRNCRGRSLSGECRWRIRRDDQGGLSAHKFCHQKRQPVVFPFREAVLDSQVPTLDEAGIGENLPHD